MSAHYFEERKKTWEKNSITALFLLAYFFLLATTFYRLEEGLRGDLEGDRDGDLR